LPRSDGTLPGGRLMQKRRTNDDTPVQKRRTNGMGWSCPPRVNDDRRMGRAKPGKRKTFAELLAEVDEPTSPPPDWPAPIPDDHWTDPDGVCWRRRGEDLSVKQIERLIRDPQVTVLHVYQSALFVPPEDRHDLWLRMRPYLTGKVDRDPCDYTDFRAAEFKYDARRSMLVIEEYC
jgi:hypothetical protein